MAVQLAESFVFGVVVDFGGRGAVGDFGKGDYVFAFHAYLEEYVAFLPVAAGGVGSLCLTD
jgi:hypothetical protein